MPIVYNDSSRIYEVTYNGTNLQQVTYNGTLVFDRRLKTTYSITISYRLEGDYEDSYEGCLQYHYPWVEVQVVEFSIVFYDPQLISEVILTNIQINYAPAPPTIGNITGDSYECWNNRLSWHWSDERGNWGEVCPVREFKYDLDPTFGRYRPIIHVQSDNEDVYPTGTLRHDQGSYKPKFSFTIQVTGKSVSGSNITFSQEISHIRLIQPTITITKDNWDSSPISGYTEQVVAQSYTWKK